MLKKPWHYLIDQFLTATNHNYKKAYKLSIAHDNRLHKRMTDNPSDLDYALAYTRYHIFHLAFKAAYEAWKSQGGMQKGDTLTLDQYLALLPLRMNKIDNKIQAFHDKGSPRYVQLFPNGHRPFYRGDKKSIIAAVKAMSTAIGTESDLAPAKLLLDGYHTEMENALNIQEGSFETTSADSTLVNQTRIAAMTGQYQNLGFFINKFPSNPDSIESLFDVELLTSPNQTIWVSHLDISEIHATLIHTFEAGDMIRAKRNGKGGLFLFLASTPGGIDSEKVVIDDPVERTFDVEEFKVEDYSLHRYLTIINASDIYDTRFLVELF